MSARDEHGENVEAKERQSPGGHIIHKSILWEAEEELERPSSALFWSGLAAGLSMGFSMIAEGLLRAHLPDTEWRPLVAKLGYPVGFLVVILGRQQLFTENTLTPVIGFLEHKTRDTLVNVLRLWLVILLANLIGALAVSRAAVHTSAFQPNVQEIFAKLGSEAMEPAFGAVLIRGIFAGWLIALIVWLLPFAEAARLWVIVIISYVVGLGSFSHIIAGAVETFAAAWSGSATWSEVFARFIAPALIGNTIGGVTLVAALNHAQIKSGKSLGEAPDESPS